MAAATSGKRCSDGIYRGLLEAGVQYMDESFKVTLVNARHLKNVSGRKTDKKDSQWICKLLLAGLLKASFIPEERIRDLRDLNRYSTKLTQEVASEKNRIQKILEDANIKLTSVVSDTSGAVASKLIDGLIAGRTDLGVYQQRICIARHGIIIQKDGKVWVNNTPGKDQVN